MMPGAYSLMMRHAMATRNETTRASVFLRAFAAAFRPTCKDRIVYAAATEPGNVSLSFRM